MGAPSNNDNAVVRRENVHPQAPSDANTTLEMLKACSRAFTVEREWDCYHDAKNLSMAVATEAGELMEHFRWLRSHEVDAYVHRPDAKEALSGELADILLLVGEFAARYEFDLGKAVQKKLEVNARRYPVSLARGNARKYTQLANQEKQMTGPNIFVFSAAGKAARQHYRRTVEQGLSLDEVLPHISDPDTRTALSEAYPKRVAYLWGAHAGGHDEDYWQRMAPGDLILAYRDRTIVAASHLVTRYRSRPLSLVSWPDGRDRPWELLYFLTPPEALRKPIGELAPPFGEVYQGLRRVACSDSVRRAYGSLDALLEQCLRVRGARIPDARF